MRRPSIVVCMAAVLTLAGSALLRAQGSVGTDFNPKKYTPGQPVTAMVIVTQASNGTLVNVEDVLPPGWTVAASSLNPAGGTITGDQTKHVTWSGSLAPGTQRTYSYVTTPPGSASGPQEFTGGKVKLSNDTTSLMDYSIDRAILQATGSCSVACTASASPSSVSTGQAVAFTATATPSGCTGTPTFAWAFGDGATSAQQSPSHVYATAGTFSWTMTATVQGVTCTRTGTVTVTAPTCTLACSATASPTSGSAPLVVTFTGSATPTNCTGSVTYSWSFGDGSSSTQKSPSHTYTTSGTFSWTVTASVQGVTCTKNGTVTVGTAPPITSPGANVYIVSAAARAGGTAGSNWVSDVVLHNPGTGGTTANLYFLRSGQANTAALGRTVTVPAQQSVKLANVVSTLFGETSASGAILIGSDTTLLVTSRTFNDTTSGTYGQYIEGYPALQAIGASEQVRLIQLTKNATYRTNIGFANATGSQLAVQATLYRGDGSQLGMRSATVPAFGYFQENDVFAKAGVTSVDDGYAVITSATPGAHYFTYASVIDGRTNDPVQIVPVGRTQSEAPPDRVGTDPLVTPGRGGLTWPDPASHPATPAHLHGGSTPRQADEPVATVSHVAGTLGGGGYADGSGSAARFELPHAVAVDASGNVYVADSLNHAVRKVTPGGAVTTLAGLPGHPGSSNGTGSAARFANPQGIAVDGAGNVYVADSENHTIRKVTPGGVVTTLAGNPTYPGSTDGTGSLARFELPKAMAVDGAGNLFLTDTANNTIRKVTPAGVVTTLAGLAGAEGSNDGTGSAARFNQPRGVALDAAGNLLVADTNNHTIRKVTPGGTVTTLAGLAGTEGSDDGTGAAARFSYPGGLAVDTAGNLHVVDTWNHLLRTVTPGGVVSVLAGEVGTVGSSDGTGSAAHFFGPVGLAAGTSGTLIVADTWNHTIRKVASGGTVTTLAGLAAAEGSTDGTGSAARFFWPGGVAADATGNLYVADSGNHTVRKITASGVVTTLAGVAGDSGSTDGTGAAARFYNPYGIAVDGAGNVIVADNGNHTIRKVTPAGVVTTLAGLAQVEGSADGTGSEARFACPGGVAADEAGTVFVADICNSTVRKITPSGVVTTLAGLAGSQGNTDGTGSAARFNGPEAVAVDGAGTVYVADTSNGLIRRITAGGIVTTLAGWEGSEVWFDSPRGIAVDGTGRVYVADTNNQIIRQVLAGGVVTTMAGLGGNPGSSDGVGGDARFADPHGIGVDRAGNLYVADRTNHAIRKVSFASCSVTLGASSQSFAAAGGTGTVSVIASSDCSWSATSSATWITVTSGATGIGSGTVSYTVAANPAAAPRTGSLAIGGQAFTVSQAGTACTAPDAPALTAPTAASSDTAYTLTWTGTSPSNTYELQDSTSSSFAGASTIAVSGTARTRIHTVTGSSPVTWYSRVRATDACGGSTFASSWSNTGQTVVSPQLPSGQAVYVPAGAHATGTAGTNWKTDLEVHNPGTAQARFTLHLLKKDLDNSSPLAASFTLSGGQSTRYSDVLSSSAVGFAFSGAATLRVTPYAGAVMVTSRTYNDQPSGTFGQFIPGQAQGEAIPHGQEARLIQLAQSAVTTTGFRTNLGMVNATSLAISIEVKLYKGDGTYLGVQTYSLPPYGFKQIGEIFKLVTSQDVVDGYAVLRTTTSGGSFFAYASVIDNRSGDPIYIPARAVTAGPQEVTITLPGNVPLVLVRIPRGAFLMGSPDTERGRDAEEESPQHQVTLTQDYYLAKTEVTQRQWAAVMGEPMTDECGNAGSGDDVPVYCVSWNDICGGATGSSCAPESFVGKLNTLLGTTAYRLPTEAEWERAARAGTTTPFWFGDDTSCAVDACTSCTLFGQYMWWCGNAAGRINHAVGSRLPNQHGLLDINGNAWEWVADWWGWHYYESSPGTDPTGPATGTARMIRGGGWDNDAAHCRSAARGRLTPDYRIAFVGFRLARSQ